MAESARPSAPLSEAGVSQNPSLRVVPSPPRGSSRYRLGELLGEGGMRRARAIDESRAGETSRSSDCAPARRPDRARKARCVRARVHLLSPAHPSARGRVFDYGVARGATTRWSCSMAATCTAFRGRLAPRLQRDARVCQSSRCSHSRSLIHRDLSRATLDARATDSQLLDFGAMTPMGPVKQVVGTPPICAPEVLSLEPLDARADLYSLGATLYYALVGRHAYPARDFRHLRALLSQTPLAPSALVPDVPPALDALVMSMLATDPAARPASAAEVFDRLSAIAELPADEQLRVSSAY